MEIIEVLQGNVINVSNEFYNPELVTSIVPGALTAYDLPDLMACPAPKKLTLVDLTDTEGIVRQKNGDDRDVEYLKRVYKEKNGEKNLKFSFTNEDPDTLLEVYKHWVN